MGTLKSFAALLLSVAALLTSVLALNAAQKKAEMQKAAAQTVTKAVVAAQEETALASALDSDTCEAKLLGTQVLNTEVGTLDATVSTAGPLGAIEAKLKPEKEESEEKKPDGTAQESAQENPANRSADDYNYPDFADGCISLLRVLMSRCTTTHLRIPATGPTAQRFFRIVLRMAAAISWPTTNLNR